jgi:hypothetical protein
MIWRKRRFDGVEYIPYFERFEKLLMANGALYREFIMVSTKTDDPFVDDFYIGVPDDRFLAPFDGFEPINDSELPKVIDTLHIADASTEEFKSRFTFRHRTR